jgi:hypothetical protein
LRGASPGDRVVLWVKPEEANDQRARAPETAYGCARGVRL